MAETNATTPPFDAEAYLEQASRMIGLEVAPEFRPGVAANLALIARMAELMMGLPLTAADEPAPVFAPGETGR